MATHSSILAWKMLWTEETGQLQSMGLPFPPPGDLPDSGIEPASPELASGFFITEPPGKTVGKNMQHNCVLRLYLAAKK